jgi:hypothetical protein
VAEQRPDVGWGGSFSRFDPGRDYPDIVVDADAALAPAPSTSSDAPVGEFDADDRTQLAVDAPKPAATTPAGDHDAAIDAAEHRLRALPATATLDAHTNNP